MTGAGYDRAKLHALAGSRAWLDAEGRFIFGKYAHKSVVAIAKHDPHYLQWILDAVENCAGEDRKIIEAALQRAGQGRR